MLGKSVFYHNIIRKYIVAVASIFKDLQIQRYDSGGAVVKTIDVPVTYAGKTKLYNKLLRDGGAQASISLPALGFILTNMEYDSTRKVSNFSEVRIESNDIDSTFFRYANPYTFNFSIAVYAKNFDDLLQIVEQVNSFFTPDYSVTVNEIPELGIKRDVRILLDSTNLAIESEYGEDDNRVVRADLEFTLKGYLYPAISDSKIINLINVNLKDLETQQLIANIQHEWDSINGEIDTTITEGE